MKKTIIAWLFSLLSGEEQKKITNDMLKVTYPEHHLRHNPRKKGVPLPLLEAME